MSHASVDERRAAVLGVGLLALLCCVPQTAQPQTQRAPAAGGNAQLTLQLQQLASERTALQAENARMKADLEQARKERDTLKSVQEGVARRSRGAEAELARVQADNARLEGDLARQKEREQELVNRFRDTATTMREVETDRATKSQRVVELERDLDQCVDRNKKLLALNSEIIAKLEDQGFWSAVARREPFTRLKRNQLENLADGFRGAADDQRVPAPATAKP